MRMGLALALALVTLAAGCGGRRQAPVAVAPPDTRVIDDLTYRVQARAADAFPPIVEAELTLENATDEPQTVTFPDGCVVLLRAYREPDRAGTPAWDQGRVVFCTMALVTPRLEPGESQSFTARANALEILGDSLPEGLYHFSVLVRPEGRPTLIPAGSAELVRRAR